MKLTRSLEMNPHGHNHPGRNPKVVWTTAVIALAFSGAAQLDAQGVARVVVAPSGGNYQTVGAALAAISPSAANPYVIDVMPGTYTENINMKSYVHLRGAGREVTTIKAAAANSNVVSIYNLVNVAVSGLKVTGGRDGIAIYYSSPTITENTLTGNGASGVASFNASPTITGNILSQNGMIGSYNQGTRRDTTITNNTISGNKLHGVVFIGSALGSLTGNTITYNASRGVSLEQSSFADIYHNSLRGNPIDIFVDSSSYNANVSLNACFNSSGVRSGAHNLHPSNQTDPCIVLN